MYTTKDMESFNMVESAREVVNENEEQEEHEGHPW
jgi:hypothetical protein